MDALNEAPYVWVCNEYFITT